MGTLKVWSAGPLDAEVRRSLERLAANANVVAVAAMPDVHLAHDVCVGTVVATEAAIFPAAIGGDIGCGVTTLKVDGHVSRIREGASDVLRQLRVGVPILKHRRPMALPAELTDRDVSAPLKRAMQREGRAQFGTVGRGNHFVEIQSDASGFPWVSVHSGSRAMGPCVQRLHQPGGSGLGSIEAASQAGEAYLRDHDWAVAYARRSREEIAMRVCAVLNRCFGFEPDLGSLIDCTHNLVRQESVSERTLWVHRKGAIPAHDGTPGVIPGSMGSPTFLVRGRGCASALNSSSHGAGRHLSRTEARKRISVKQLRRETRGVVINDIAEARLVEEAPGAYKDIWKVMRAQTELTKVIGTLDPVLNYKGG